MDPNALVNVAMDGIMGGSAVFGPALFLGLAISPLDPASTLAPVECVVGLDVSKSVFLSYLAAFICQAVSYYLASFVKVLVQAEHQREEYRDLLGWLPQHVRPLVPVACAVFAKTGAILTCMFLILAIGNLWQVRFGRFGCGGNPRAFLVWVFILPVVMMLYLAAAMFLVIRRRRGAVVAAPAVVAL